MHFTTLNINHTHDIAHIKRRTFTPPASSGSDIETILYIVDRTQRGSERSETKHLRERRPLSALCSIDSVHSSGCAPHVTARRSGQGRVQRIRQTRKSEYRLSCSSSNMCMKASLGTHGQEASSRRRLRRGPSSEHSTRPLATRLFLRE